MLASRCLAKADGRRLSEAGTWENGDNIRKKTKTSYVPTAPISSCSGDMPARRGLSKCLVLWSFSALQSCCVLADWELLAHLILPAVHGDLPGPAAPQWVSGLGWRNTTTWESLVAPLKIFPDFYWILSYHKVSAWIWALILHSTALSQAGWGSAFPSETTTDSTPPRERNGAVAVFQGWGGGKGV